MAKPQSIVRRCRRKVRNRDPKVQPEKESEKDTALDNGYDAHPGQKRMRRYYSEERRQDRQEELNFAMQPEPTASTSRPKRALHPADFETVGARSWSNIEDACPRHFRPMSVPRITFSKSRSARPRHMHCEWPQSQSVVRSQGDQIAALSPQSVPQGDQRVPLSPQQAPQGDQIVPLSSQSVPQDDQRVPLSPQSVPQGDQIVHLSPQSVPQGDQRVPLSPQSVPQGDQRVPLSPQSVPR
ncbi:hypothetical protein CDAR_176011 [Caerostris darwini]|uniref:Uncharacterized protein n=1 Tax=Caerostris darwini TaxID=1538125 RepID=A0AAV4WMW7_9ARAC|nr:hypothetical protein CDAR_176011 [Caerostris darwini]